ncbi:hypothetical protein J7M07_08125 [bacterium]|nr:hypothetical protein [bacterium]
MKNKNSHSFSALFAFALILLTSGCYTILNHPRVESEPYETNEYYSCSECHNYNDYANYYTPVAYPDMWSNYYIQPWWYHEISDMEEQDIPTRSIIGNRNLIIRSDHLNSNTINVDRNTSIIREGTESDANKNEKTIKVIQKKNETSRMIKGNSRENRKSSTKTHDRGYRDNNREDNNEDDKNNRSSHKKRDFK